LKVCVACAEQIQAAALLCRHCGTDQRDERFAIPEGSKEISSKGASSHSRAPDPDPVGPSTADVKQGGGSFNATQEAGIVSFCKSCNSIIQAGQEQCSICYRSAGPKMSRTPKSLSAGWPSGIGPRNANLFSQPSRVWLITASLALLVLIFIAFIISGQSQPAGTQTPQKSVGQESYEFGVEVGRGLAAQNRFLFPDKDGQCASAFNYYVGSRNLEFDRFIVGCKAGWEIPLNR
jgi:RNA polymerase subunit RPABC4/transcription elongation factor Spt4